MKNAIFDVSLWEDRETAYQALADALEFPDWFGRNLDALNDLLSEGEYAITLVNTASAPKKLNVGPLVRVIRDAGALKAEYPGNEDTGTVAPDFLCVGRENLTIGRGVTIGPRVTVIAHAKVTIGDWSVIGAGTVITTDPVEKGGKPQPVKIGKNAVIGVQCAILPGAVVEDGETVPHRGIVG